ncbi:MAG TPA: acyl-CoA dehydrogenase family protein [Acidimicrobiales bacterium]|nr:acyl-CoA dehydrogenase family protein [Acidimicrobiales bacterium]
MDFSFSEEQEAVRDLARQIFEGRSTPERVRQVEGGADRFDRELWAELAKANLLGISLPEGVGGSGLGLIESLLVLEEAGRRVAPVPLWPTLFLGAFPVAEFGSDEQRSTRLPGVVEGEIVLTGAYEEFGANDPLRSSVTADDDRLTGEKPAVPAAHVAERVLVPAETDGVLSVFVVDPRGEGVTLDLDEATNRQIHAEMTFAGASGERLGGDGAALVQWTLERAALGLCALQVGVCESALHATAEYTSHREQFGRPLSTNQGVALRAADAYIDIEAMRATLWAAAWRLTEGLPAAAEVAAAKWWASEGGHRVVHSTQHLHGGIGADIEYPLHRTFLWAKQLAHTLGGPSQQLARLGRILREEAMA